MTYTVEVKIQEEPDGAWTLFFSQNNLSETDARRLYDEQKQIAHGLLPNNITASIFINEKNKNMTYTLNVKITGNKAGRYHYTVTDATGKFISERKSNRKYVACTADGSFYFGRLDLIGKGDHGKQIKFAQGWGYKDRGGYFGHGDKLVPGVHPVREDQLAILNAIAYLDDTSVFNDDNGTPATFSDIL